MYAKESALKQVGGMLLLEQCAGLRSMHQTIKRCKYGSEIPSVCQLQTAVTNQHDSLSIISIHSLP